MSDWNGLKWFFSRSDSLVQVMQLEVEIFLGIYNSVRPKLTKALCTCYRFDREIKQDKCVTEEEYSKWREWGNYIQPFLDEQGHSVNKVLIECPCSKLLMFSPFDMLSICHLWNCLSVVWLWRNKPTTKRSNTYKMRGGILPIKASQSNFFKRCSDQDFWADHWPLFWGLVSTHYDTNQSTSQSSHTNQKVL